MPVGTWGARPRVDLLCRAHRVVVELDGPEHRTEPKFGNDRHRDYELLTAGYLVLRLTNEQVAADLPLAIEKIRAVVRLRAARPRGSDRRDADAETGPDPLGSPRPARPGPQRAVSGGPPECLASSARRRAASASCLSADARICEHRWS
ncbi:DUF559 domain-containing protein [Methylobacterium sp. R2-1]|uniref:endonuclease domain-containing protein n=1 Tax=Methylobacterium sp. R2-1 TaxID=2587064 RepID=UPI001618532B